MNSSNFKASMVNFSSAKSWSITQKHHLCEQMTLLVGKRQSNGRAYTAITCDLCRGRKHYNPATWQTTNGMSMREFVCVRGEGKRGVLSLVEMRGKTNILHHVPSHTFPHWLWLFKSSCQWCLSASLSLCLGLRELRSTFRHTDKLRWI